MALKCYPLQSGGLLAIEAIFLGMASPYDVYHEIQINFTGHTLISFHGSWNLFYERPPFIHLYQDTH